MIVTWNPDDWVPAREKPLARRLAPASDDAIDYVAQINAALDLPHRPQAAEVSRDLLADVGAALAELPASVTDRLENSLLGVHFARGLGSSGITDVVATAGGEILGAVILLNVDTLEHRTANQWATWKENTPFDPTGPLAVEARIESTADDNRKNAIQYILLHEFGHVLGIDSAFLPNWWLLPRQWRADGDYDFLSLCWQLAPDQRIVPRPGNDFPLRSRLAFYGGNRLGADAPLETYRALGTTGFPTLYAATNAYDDFAESFASYVHCVLMNKPLEIRVLGAAEVLLETDDFWRSGRCPQKGELLAAFLGSG